MLAWLAIRIGKLALYLLKTQQNEEKTQSLLVLSQENMCMIWSAYNISHMGFVEGPQNHPCRFYVYVNMMNDHHIIINLVANLHAQLSFDIINHIQMKYKHIL